MKDKGGSPFADYSKIIREIFKMGVIETTEELAIFLQEQGLLSEKTRRLLKSFLQI